MPTNTKQQLCIKPTGFLVVIYSHLYSSKRPRAGGRELGQVRESVYGGGCRGAAPTALVCEVIHDTHPNSNLNDPSLAGDEGGAGAGAGANGCGGNPEADYRATNTHQSGGGETVEYRCGNCDIAQQDQKWVWMPILEVCTQRRLCCAPSVHFQCTTSIL